MKIGIFGNFGWGNLGNSATLEAAVAGVRTHWPSADLLCICADPDEVQSPVRFRGGSRALGFRRGSATCRKDASARTAAKLVQRPPAGSAAVAAGAVRCLEDLDLLLVAGTGRAGRLCDRAHGSCPTTCLSGRCRRSAAMCRLAYLSTGAGPIDHRRSRVLLTEFALGRAFYRSYRDEYSRTLILRCVRVRRYAADSIYPDLAFGLPIAEHLRARRESGTGESGLVVGLGVMSYSGSQTGAEEGEAIYQKYLQKIVPFGSQLLASGHTVRLVWRHGGRSTRV